MVTVVTRIEMPIQTEDDVVLVRRRAQAMAQERGFDAFATAALTTASSELSRNVWRHGGGGSAVLEGIEDERRSGVRIEFSDHGPGIANLERALVGGYSTARSLGLGLSGSRRLVDEFHVDTTPGQGTTVRIVKWTRY